MSGAWRTTVVAVSLTATLTGCSLVSQPDATSWDDQATQALSDAAGQVGTARMALDSARKGRTWSSYTVVLVAQAEEAMGTTQDKVSTLQVPAGREKRAAHVEQPARRRGQGRAGRARRRRRRAVRRPGAAPAA
ncbi:hypothetical protein G5V59_12395 [Nocardioides sp. W3-2-3]|uniref:hypothetical protein n=1 Tax=Nocardioides convexus TaxID=2712224 RepID=UPI0024185F3C|nr:hypothetical protein [Nocardioides convexus]NHA00549.1 hypothetical protein [Nocardioides convexus]